MNQLAAQAKYERIHDAMPYHDGTFEPGPGHWGKERSDAHPYRFNEGVTVWVSADDLTPDDPFLDTPVERAVQPRHD